MRGVIYRVISRDRLYPNCAAPSVILESCFMALGVVDGVPGSLLLLILEFLSTFSITLRLFGAFLIR